MIPIDRGGGGYARTKAIFPLREIFNLCLAPLLLILLIPTFSAAQAQRGTLVHEESIRVAPDAQSAKLGEAERGHELIIIETTPNWTHVEAIIREPKRDRDEDDEDSQAKTITGWVSGKALVSMTTPNGDKVIFGEAADSEDQASRRHGRRDAALDAMRLYYRVYDLFPTSPVAAEGLYRAADIRWQMDRSDVMTRPSARERDSYMRGQLDEEWMKLVIKKYPGTKWADLADFHLIDNKLCGDWQGQEKCPEKEAELYEKYAAERPDGPRTAQALYQAVYRQAVLTNMYADDNNDKKSDAAHAHARDLAARLKDKFPQSDYTARAAMLVFKLDQGIPVYGIEKE
jgi:hypothetical protein